jgi:hypothetical protein
LFIFKSLILSGETCVVLFTRSASGKYAVREKERPGEPDRVLPLAPLAPVFRGEVKAFGVNAQVTLLHCPLMPLHYVLRKSQDILALRSHRKRRGSNMQIKIALS